MSKISAVEVLSRLVERVRLIERESAQVAAVMERMIAAGSKRSASTEPEK
jgi:hypothetical protein